MIRCVFCDEPIHDESDDGEPGDWVSNSFRDEPRLCFDAPEVGYGEDPRGPHAPHPADA